MFTEMTHQELIDGAKGRWGLGKVAVCEAELLRRLGAAVSASPQPRCPECSGDDLGFWPFVGQISCNRCSTVVGKSHRPYPGLGMFRLSDFAQFFAAAPAQEPRDVPATSKAAQEPFVPRCLICGEVEANYRHSTETANKHYYHKFKPAQEQPVENSRTYEQGVADAEQREIKAIREGYKAEICRGCDAVLLAHKHFVACQKSDCPMKDGKGSVLEQLLLDSPQKGKP